MRGLIAFGFLALISIGSINAQSDWWETMTLYQVYPRSWMDSDGDGIGDLKGIESKLPHLVDAGVDAFWMSPIYASPMADFGYDISDFREIDSIFGTMTDFESLIATAKSLGLKVIMDYVPNHTSDEHEWFTRSLAGEDPYTDYYVWHNGTIDSVTGIVSPPNNWVSVFGGSAWTWRTERQAYYLHQFVDKQPDLNFNNENVVQEMKDVLVFWLDKGVDGFRIDAISHLFEVDDFADEPISGLTNDTTLYDYLLHDYTRELPATYDMVGQWRELLDNYTLYTDNVTRVLMTEAYANVSATMRYYEAGAHFSFNFGFISNVDSTATAAEIKELVIDQWLDNLPENATSNWVIGNHDRNRVASRYSPEQVDALNMLDLLLPGVSVTYYGEEIGMEDQWLSWEDTVDPKACNSDEETYESLSRDPARTPFQWNASTSAGFSSNATTWLPVNDNYLTLNLAAQVAADVSHYKVYQALTALRKETVMQQGSVNVQLLNDNVLAFSRELNGTDPVFVVVSFTNSTQNVSLEVLPSASDNLVVSIASTDSSLTAGTQVTKSSLLLSAYAGLVLRNDNSTTENSTTTTSTTTESTATNSTTTTSTTTESTATNSTTTESTTTTSTTTASTTTNSTTTASTTTTSTTTEPTTTTSTTTASTTTTSTTTEPTTTTSTTTTEDPSTDDSSDANVLTGSLLVTLFIVVLGFFQH